MKFRENISIIFQIFKRDLLRLIRNPLATIVVLGVCLMPSLYAWYTIAANWDPYQNTSAIKVAVSNEDEGADSELTGHIDIGKQVEDKLHKDHNLGWQFVSEKDALDGVESGEYYAAIIIPKDFSKDFLSVFTGDFKKPTLDYYVNEKISAVVPKITDTGATTIENQINESFVETVSKTVVQMTQKAGKEVEDDSNAADGSLTSGIDEANEAIGKTRQTLNDLGPTFDSSQQAVDDAQTTLDTLSDKLPALASSLDDAETTLEHMRTSISSYGTQLTGDVTSAALSLGQAAAQANTAIAQVSADLTQAQGEVDTALAEARHLLQQNQTIIDDLKPYEETHPEITGIIDDLQTENDRLEQTVSNLQSLSDSLSSAASASEQAATSINDAAEQASKDLVDASTALQQNILPKINASLDDFAKALGTLHGVCVALEPEIDQGKSTLSLLSETLDQAQQATTMAADSLTAIQTDLSSSLTDLQALRNSASVESLSTYLGMNANEIGDFMSSPVELKTIDIYPVKTYGSGVAPFYTNLALWVAGFILVAILHLWVDPRDLPRFSVTQAYLGRWLMFMLLGIIQGLIVCIGDLVLGIQCENPVAFVFAGLVTVFVDVNIMYALVFTMRHLGRAIGVIVLIMQIPGSSGEYPVEMMPQFFQIIHPFLPFTYSIDAMREAIGGMYDGHYWTDLGALIPFLVVALAFGLIAGRYAFNLNALFDRELSKTNLFICEAPGTLRERFRLRSMLRALLDTDAYRDALTERLARFKRGYPRLIRIGWCAVAALPLAMLAFAFAVHADNEVKVILLICMVAGIFVVGGYLIIIEFLNTNLAYQMEISTMDAQDMLKHVERAKYVNENDTPPDDLTAIEPESLSNDKAAPLGSISGNEETHPDGNSKDDTASIERAEDGNSEDDEVHS